MRPEVQEAATHRTVRLNDVAFIYKLQGVDTDGSVAALHVTIPPRTLVKPHQHSREDEFSLILSGQVGARIGETTHEEIAAGSSLIKPRNVPHAMWNLTNEAAEIIEIVAPAGLEQYFEEVAPILREHGREWTERFDALAASYGLTILGDWSDELTARYDITL